MITLFGEETSEPEGDKTRPFFLSNSNEWYTPEVYLKAARRVMGTIDLDPASSALANKTVQATRYFTQEDDGLAQPWRGRVWLNPPYGKSDDGASSNVQRWVNKLISEHACGHVQEALLLVNAVPDRRWFDPLWEYPICFARTRLVFFNPSLGAAQGARPTNANVIVYFGENEPRFIAEFCRFGRIARAIDPPTPAPPGLWDAAQDEEGRE